MKLITTDAQLRALIPNVLVTVTGETSLIDKMTPFLEEAERWLSDNFLSDSVLDSVVGLDETSVTRQLSSKIVCMEAFRNSVPFLDVVLTPNGFGIVSNSNIAPASKERVERLRNSALALRDEYIESLIPTLYSIEQWRQAEQCTFFGTTMFPNISLVRHFMPEKDRWTQYITLRNMLISVEQSISDLYIGKEQMDVFRSEVLSGSISTSHRTMIDSLRSVEIAILRSLLDGKPCECHYHQLDSIVNVIRNDETNFPEWHSSSVKELFSPKIYENKKSDTAYWF